MIFGQNSHQTQKDATIGSRHYQSANIGTVLPCAVLVYGLSFTSALKNAQKHISLGLALQRYTSRGSYAR